MHHCLIDEVCHSFINPIGGGRQPRGALGRAHCSTTLSPARSHQARFRSELRFGIHCLCYRLLRAHKSWLPWQTVFSPSAQSWPNHSSSLAAARVHPRRAGARHLLSLLLLRFPQPEAPLALLTTSRCLNSCRYGSCPGHHSPVG